MITDINEFKEAYVKDAEESGYTREDVEEAFSLGFPFNVEWFKKGGKVSDRNYLLYECIYGMDKSAAIINLQILKEKGIPLEEYAKPIDTRY